MAESMIGNLDNVTTETGWSPLPRGKTTLKCAGVFGAGVVTFKGGKIAADGTVKEYALGTEGVFDSTTAGARNITIASDKYDVVKATVASADGTTDLDIYVSPVINAT